MMQQGVLLSGWPGGVITWMCLLPRRCGHTLNAHQPSAAWCYLMCLRHLQSHPFSCHPTPQLTPCPSAMQPSEKKKPVVVKYGLNHITGLVESKKASLVVIAHDVDPIEMVVWLPALCKRMDVPYVIVKVKILCLGGLVSGAQGAYLVPSIVIMTP